MKGIVLKKGIVLIFCFVFFISAVCFAQSKTIDSLKKVLKKDLADSTRLRTIKYLVNCFEDASEFDSVITQANKGIVLANRSKDSVYTQRFYNRIGVAYWNMSSYDKALENYTKGLKFCQTEEQKGSYYNNIGLVYWDKGELPKALDYFLRSYDIDKKYKNESGMASSLLNMGLIYDDLKDYKNAVRYYYLSLELSRKLNDLATIGICYNNLGKLFGDGKNPAKALDFYYKAFNTSVKAGDKKNAAMATNNIGCIYVDKENLDSALKYLNWSYDTFSEVGDLSGLALVVNNLGQLYFNKGNYKKAVEIYENAIKVNRAANNIEDLAISYRGIALALSKLGDHRSALTCFTLYDGLRDTILQKQNTLLLSDIRKEYDIKEAEKVVNLKREADRKVAASEKKRQGFIILSVIFILGVVLIFSIFLFRRFKITQKQKGIIESQKHLVEEKQKEILDSIHYAKRIQTTIIANQEFINESIPENFIYFFPKDIVSGDFYWATKRDHLFYLAICDSTGHGVPGAFMSLLNIGFLSEAINEKNIERPDKIFNYVRERLVNSISKEGQKDGFDGILICVDTLTKKLTYAAANNEPILIRNSEVIELPKDKMPVGIGERKEDFKYFEPELYSGDTLYFYTDGYADQFGGPKGKKFKYKQLNELLLATSVRSMEEQKEVLKQTFESWRGDLEQVDDVCIIGIRL